MGCVFSGLAALSQSPEPRGPAALAGQGQGYPALEPLSSSSALPGQPRRGELSLRGTFTPLLWDPVGAAHRAGFWDTSAHPAGLSPPDS